MNQSSSSYEQRSSSTIEDNEDSKEEIGFQD